MVYDGGPRTQCSVRSAGVCQESAHDHKDLEIQHEHGVKYHHYWFNEESGDVFCLAEAPSKEAAEAVHCEAHGLVADGIVEVEEDS